MDRYQTTFATWDALALLYQEKFMDVELYNDTYDMFCEGIKKQNAAVFEIGCGPGNITKYLLTKRPDLSIDAIDVSPNMIELAKQNNPSINASVMDARDINSITKKYDGIMCGFCIPYLSNNDCKKLVQDCSQLLNKDGVFYCSAIEGDPERSGYESGSSGDKAFVYYYRQDSIEKMLEENGFANITTIHKQYPARGGSTQVHLIVIATIE